MNSEDLVVWILIISIICSLICICFPNTKVANNINNAYRLMFDIICVAVFGGAIMVVLFR